jgi:zinc transport system substrate-binding protein
VLTTTVPVTLFTRAVAGDCAEVTPLVPPGSGPHGFQSRPQDLLALRRARLLVINGLGLETFLEPLLRSAAPASLTVIDSSRGVATLAAAPPSLAPAEAGADHSHRPEGRVRDLGPAVPPSEAHAHGSGGVNPHIWLDPRRAIQQVATIRDGLIAADPTCAAGYRQRAAAYTAELRRLDADLAHQLQPLRGRTFVVFHDFAPYFAERYGLRAEFLVPSPEQAPAPSDLRRVAEVVLLAPPQDSSRVFDNLARDLGVRVAPFSAMESLDPAERADPGTYSTILRRNATALRHAFGP